MNDGGARVEDLGESMIVTCRQACREKRVRRLHPWDGIAAHRPAARPRPGPTRDRNLRADPFECRRHHASSARRWLGHIGTSGWVRRGALDRITCRAVHHPPTPRRAIRPGQAWVCGRGWLSFYLPGGCGLGCVGCGAGPYGVIVRSSRPSSRSRKNQERWGMVFVMAVSAAADGRPPRAGRGVRLILAPVALLVTITGCSSSGAAPGRRLSLVRVIGGVRLDRSGTGRAGGRLRLDRVVPVAGPDHRHGRLVHLGAGEHRRRAARSWTATVSGDGASWVSEAPPEPATAYRVAATSRTPPGRRGPRP